MEFEVWYWLKAGFCLGPGIIGWCMFSAILASAAIQGRHAAIKDLDETLDRVRRLEKEWEALVARGKGRCDL